MPLPEFAGSAYVVVVVEPEPDVEPDFTAALVGAARTFGAVAAAWAASTPTAASEAMVIIRTENVAPRPDFFGLPGRCGSARRVGGGEVGPEGDGPEEDGPDEASRLRCPAARVPLPMGAIMPYRYRTG